MGKLQNFEIPNLSLQSISSRKGNRPTQGEKTPVALTAEQQRQNESKSWVLRCYSTAYEQVI